MLAAFRPALRPALRAAFRSTPRLAFARAFSVSASRSEVRSPELLNKTVDIVDLISLGQVAAVQDTVKAPAPSSPLLPTRTNDSRPTIMQIPPAEDPLLNYFASRLMKHGKRQHANRIVSRTLLHIHAMTRAPPLPIFRAAVLAAAPALRIMSHRQSTKTIHKPIAISERKRTWYAVEWLVKSSHIRAGKSLEERLAREMIAIVQNDPKSVALKKKEELHKMAMINRGNVPKRS